MPERNVGPVDRTVRLLAGVALLALAGLALSGVAQTLAGLAGVILLVTGALRTCPLYCALGVSTCPIRRPPAA